MVTGDVSNINGSLLSDPTIEVFLINPNGIIFGSTARIDVGSFVASTLGITDNDFLLGDAVPTQLTFQGGGLTGITVQNGAQLTTEQGRLALIGGFVDVNAGGVVSGATDVAFVAAGSVNIPADPGSPLTYAITTFGWTPVSNGINVNGQVSGRSVAMIQENQANAVNALLSVGPSATITATRAGGGDIVLSLAARTTSESIPASSPGRIENQGELTASGSIYLGGAVATSSFQFHAPHSGSSGGLLLLPLTVENAGTIDAGADVLMQAHHLVTNLGAITADGNVTLSALATGYESAPIPSVQVVNDGTINAGGNVKLVANISITASASAYATGPLSARVTNSGSISAGGDVNLNAIIDAVATVSASASEAASANARVLNSGSIDAGGDVKLIASIDALAVPYATGPVTAAGATGNVQVTNSGSIDAGGNVSLLGTISLAASDVTFDTPPNADVEIANSGSITAGGDVHLVGSIDAVNLATPVNASVHVANSGAITATGNVFLTAEAFVSGPLPNIDVVNDGSIIAGGNVQLFANIGNVTNSGAISAGGSVALFADSGDITNSGSISAGKNFTALASNGSIENGGTIDAGGNADLFADNNITNSGVISVDGVAVLDAGNDIDNSGSVSAGGDAILTAVNDILDFQRDVRWDDLWRRCCDKRRRIGDGRISDRSRRYCDPCRWWTGDRGKSHQRRDRQRPGPRRHSRRGGRPFDRS